MFNFFRNKSKDIIDKKSVSDSDLQGIIKDLLNFKQDSITDGLSAWKYNSWVNWGVKLITTKMSSAEYSIYKDGNEDYVANRLLLKINGVQINIIAKMMEFWRIVYGYSVLYLDRNGNLNFVRSDKTSFDSKSRLHIINGNSDKIYTKYFVYNENPIDVNTLGTSPLNTVIDYVDVEYKSIQSLKNMLKQGALISLMMINEKPVGKEQTEQLMNTFAQAYSGIDNSGSIPFVSGGWKPEQNVIDLQKMAINTIDALVKNQVSTVLGIPISMMNDTESNTAAREKLVQDRKRFIYDTLIPRTNDFALFFNNVLDYMFPGKGYTLEYDYSKLLDTVADRKLEEDIRAERVINNYMTINEARNEIGLDNIEGGDDLYLNLNKVPISDISDYTIPDNNKNDNNKKSIDNKSVDVDSKIFSVFWKSYYKRFIPQEKKIYKILNKFFDILEKSAIEKYTESYNNGTKSFNVEKKFLDSNDLVKKYNKMMLPYIKSFSQQSIDGVIIDYALDIDFNVDNIKISTFISKMLQDSASEIIRTSEKRLAPIIENAINSGESINDTIKNIKELFKDDKKRRIPTIARTEVNKINNYSAVEAAKEGGLKKKTWISALMDTTREWHREASGQTVDINDKFFVNGELLDFPGDPSGSAENVINCVCTVLFS